MSTRDPESAPVRGLIDSGGRLAQADPLLADLNRQAGGRIGAPLAVPELAAIARLARRLAVLVSRRVVVAEGRGDLELWVRARPGDDGIALTITGWRVRPAAMARATTSTRPVPTGDWQWEADASLRLTGLSPCAGPREGFHPAAMLGQPLTGLFGLSEEADGTLPLLAALAANDAFEGQRAQVRPSGRDVVLAAVPRRDRVGGFAGFVGSVTALPDAEPAQPGSIDLFAARLGSALKSPLGRIIANADSIHAAPDGPVNETYAGYAADIASAGRHLLGLVDDLVDLEAVERADFVVACEPIDLADVARRAAGLLAVRAAAAQVTIERPGEGASVPATGEFRRVLQILVNLIGNAVRYAPAGSTVTVRADAADGVATVAVRDTGKGIAPDDQVRVFEKFERVDPSEPGGSGLGLYISRRLARAMGGDIDVDSTPGEGACFTLSLPAR